MTINFEDRKSGGLDSLNCDKCLIAVGRVPYTDGLGLNEMGVEMDNRGRVIVNSKWQSVTHSNIYAIGDVIDGPMLAHKAEDEGIATANVICGLNAHVGYNAIPSVIYGQPEVAFVGKTEEQLKEENIAYKKGEFPFMASSRARTNMDPFANTGSVKVLADKATDLILGVHIIGPNAGEMIAEAVIGIEYCASAEDFALSTHAHPTLSESFREACMLASTGKCIHF